MILAQHGEISAFHAKDLCDSVEFATEAPMDAPRSLSLLRLISPWTL
jgi:hypothetical protein